MIRDAIKILDNKVKNPKNGLPDEIFYYISRTTPLINVDLLIKHPKKGVLLSWREDEHHGKGWHIPGGIIRYKEEIGNRIHEVARIEIGTDYIQYDSNVLAINQIIAHEKKDRAHFISLLYQCHLDDHYEIYNKGKKQGEPGYLKWFQDAPMDLLSWHEIYRAYITKG